MSDLFRGFKRELKTIRAFIEQSESFSFDDLVCYLDDGILEDVLRGSDPFNKKVLLYRVIDQNREEQFTRQSILRFLSEWEIFLN